MLECIRGLHQPAELDGARKIARRGDEQREEGGELAGDDLEGEVFGAAQDESLEILIERSEAAERDGALLRLAGIERDALGLLAQPHQAEAEIGLEALLAVAQRDQRASDEMRQHRRDAGIEDGGPEHVARDGDREVFRNRQGDAAREVPQDGGERDQRHDRAEQPEAEAQRLLDEEPDVLRDALIGIVDLAEEAHAVEGTIGEPAAEIAVGQPAPPAQLECQVEVVAQQRDGEIGEDERDDGAEGTVEGVRIARLEPVIHGAPGGVEQHADIDHAEIEGDDGGQQDPRRPALLAAPVASRQAPDLTPERCPPRHSRLLKSPDCRGDEASIARGRSILRLPLRAQPTPVFARRRPIAAAWGLRGAPHPARNGAIPWTGRGSAW